LYGLLAKGVAEGAGTPNAGGWPAFERGLKLKLAEELCLAH